eukprot:5519777-Prymnesium_polylepis.1
MTINSSRRAAQRASNCSRLRATAVDAASCFCIAAVASCCCVFSPVARWRDALSSAEVALSSARSEPTSSRSSLHSASSSAIVCATAAAAATSLACCARSTSIAATSWRRCPSRSDTCCCSACPSTSTASPPAVDCASARRRASGSSRVATASRAPSLLLPSPSSPSRVRRWAAVAVDSGLPVTLPLRARWWAAVATVQAEAGLPGSVVSSVASASCFLEIEPPLFAPAALACSFTLDFGLPCSIDLLVVAFVGRIGVLRFPTALLFTAAAPIYAKDPAAAVSDRDEQTEVFSALDVVAVDGHNVVVHRQARLLQHGAGLNLFHPQLATYFHANRRALRRVRHRKVEREDSLHRRAAEVARGVAEKAGRVGLGCRGGAAAGRTKLESMLDGHVL